MCREFKIVTYLELEGLREIMDQFSNIDSYLECNVDIIIGDKETDNHIVIVEAINGHCLCNMAVNEKEIIFNFIHAISF